MKKTIIKESPIAELTLRKYEKPYKLNDRELVRKLCLSIGLLQPGDSRDVIVDVFYTLLHSKNPLSSKQVEQGVVSVRKGNKLALTGITPPNIRRQLRRLKGLLVIERIGGTYRIAENSSLNDLFEDKIEKFYLPAIISRIKEYCEAIEKERKK